MLGRGSGLDEEDEKDSDGSDESVFDVRPLTLAHFEGTETDATITWRNSLTHDAPVVLPISVLTVAVVDWLASKKFVGAAWRTHQHEHLDFSDTTLFCLGTLRLNDLRWGSRMTRPAKDEERYPAIAVSKLQTLNLDQNQITDQEFYPDAHLNGYTFCSLRTLHVSHNLLQYPVILLPRLRKLDISKNSIKWVPPLSGMPQLEVLNLAYNLIPYVEESKFDEAKQLESLNLGSNQIDMTPSSLRNLFDRLAKNHDFVRLELAGNPFCVFFPEYQVLALSCMPQLTRMDDLSFGPQDGHSRRDLLTHAQHVFGTDKGFDTLDDKVAERKRVGEKEEAMSTASTVNVEVKPEHRLPSIQSIVEELDDAIADSSSAAVCVQVVFDNVSRIASVAPEHYFYMFEAGGRNAKRKKPKFTDDGGDVGGRRAAGEAVHNLLQQVRLLYDRHENLHPLLLRILAKLSPVRNHELGENCMILLSSLSVASRGSADLVRDIFSEMIIPQITDNPSAEDQVQYMILALRKVQFQGFAGVLTPLIPPLSRLFKYLPDKDNDPRVVKQRLAFASLLHKSLLEKKNAVELVRTTLGQDVLHTKIISELYRASQIDGVQLFGRKDLYDQEVSDKIPAWELVAEFVGILRACLAHLRKDTMDIIKAHGNGDLPTRLVHHCDRLFSERNDDVTLLSLTEAKMISSTFDLMSDLIEDPEVAQVMLRVDDKKHQRRGFLEVVVLAPADPGTSDPMVLTASLNCLCAILSSKEPRNRSMEFIVDKLCLRGNTTVLPYLEAKRIGDLYKICEKHQRHKEHRKEVVMSGSANLNFATCTNSIFHRTIIAIIRFIGIFPIMSADRSELGQLCKEVSQNLNARGREHFMLMLLQIPSPALQEAIVGALGDVDSSELDDTEVSDMVGLLIANLPIQGREGLLGNVLMRLRDIAELRGKVGEFFRATWAEKIIQFTFDLLKLTGEAQIEFLETADHAKDTLEFLRRAVVFLAMLSRNGALRKFFRGPNINKCTLKVIMKAEEQHFHHSIEDTNVELTWTGRSVAYLMECLEGDGAVRRDKKQAFRVISRLADVMMGVSDAENEAGITGAEDRSHRELSMWSEKTARQHIGSLDEASYEDRTTEQQRFVTMYAVERVAIFLQEKVSQKARKGQATMHSLMNMLSEADDLDEHVYADPALAEATFVRNKMVKFLDGITQYARDRVRMEEARRKEELGRDHPVEVVLPTLEWNAPMDVTKYLGQTFNKTTEVKEFTAEHNLGAFDVVPDELRTNEAFYDDPAKGIVNQVFMAAALLRAVYAVVAFPGTESIRREMTHSLRQVVTQLHLISIVERCGTLVDCHIAAKLMRIMLLVLRASPDFTNPDDKNNVIGLMVMSQFAAHCLLHLKPLLGDLNRDSTLTHQQEVLSAESVRLLGATVSTISVMRLSSQPLIQAECVQIALKELITKHAIRTIVLCLLYDMRASAGNFHGENITEKYAKNAIGRASASEASTELLSGLLEGCPGERYKILEIVNEYGVLGNITLRASLMAELLGRANRHKFRIALDRMFQDRSGNMSERILQVEQVDLPQPGGIFWSATAKPRTLLLTTQRLVIMGRPLHGMLLKPCGMCPPGSFCPIGPSIEYEIPYSQITSLVVGPDSQMLVVGSVPKDKTREKFDIFICHDRSARYTLLSALPFLVGNARRGALVQPVQDEILKVAVLRFTPMPPIVMTYALRRTLIGERLSLFVLTEAELFEFDVHVEHWQAPSVEVPVCMDDDYQEDGNQDEEDPLTNLRQLRRAKPPMHSELSQWLNKDGDSSVSQQLQESEAAAEGVADENGETKKEAEKGTSIMGFSLANMLGDVVEERTGKMQKKKLENSATKILKRLACAKNHELQQVQFDADDMPILTLTYRGMADTVEIRFLDDGSREQWRGSLALVMNKEEYAVHWRRDWL